MKTRSLASKLLSIVLSAVMLLGGLSVIADTSGIRAYAMYQSEYDTKIQALMKKYPNYSRWTDSFEGGIQCLGFAHMLGYEVFGVSPLKWQVSDSLKDVKAGDILRYGQNNGRGHSIYVLDVEGDIITFAECNGIANSYSGECAVAWGVQTSISRGYCYSHPFLYRLVAPERIYNDIHNNGSYYTVVGTNVTGTGKVTVNKGTRMTFRALFADGEGTKSYKCIMKKTTDSQWTLVKDYSSTSVFSITNSNTGSYIVKLIGRDARKHADNVNFFFDVVSQPLKNNGTYIKEKGSSKKSTSNLIVTKGKTLTVKPVFSGGYGNLRYKYMWKKTTDSSWKVLQDYSSRVESMDIKASYTGDYVVKVIVRDANSNAVSTDIRYKVENLPLKNNGSKAVCDYSTVYGNSVSVIQNVPVTYMAKFTNVIGKIQYKYEYRRTNESTYTTLKDYSSDSSYTLKLPKVGKYNVRILAKDGSGKSASAVFTQTVTKAPLKDSGTCLDYMGTSYFGFSVKVKAGYYFTIQPDFENNGYDYTVKAEVKKIGEGGYVELENPFYYIYEIMRTDYCFEEAGRYSIRLTATDDYGNTAAKTFTINVSE